jgi:2-dehydro-3-deoxyphosphooctonate aldolase (KDO 8-P synthase)
MPYPAYPSLASQFSSVQTEVPFVVIAGPCVLEGDGQLNLETARRLKKIMERFPQIQFYFKSSFDKANRTSNSSYRGLGLQEGLATLQRIKEDVGVSLLTDIHSPEQAEAAAAVVDVLQIPAFLCRQTDLLVAAAETGRIVNVKKGQFLSPPEAEHCISKVQQAGNPNVWMTERGSSFGYNNLLVDMRSFTIMNAMGVKTIFDATHSVQQPGALNGKSGGNRLHAPVLARAAVAAGCQGLFFETHPNPDAALSDGPNQIPLEWVEPLLEECLSLRAALLKATVPSLAV